MAGNDLAIVENIRLQLKDINQLAQKVDLVGQRMWWRLSVRVIR